MKKKYNYICKTCWHMWNSYKLYTVCPKCKSEELDVQEELMFEG